MSGPHGGSVQQLALKIAEVSVLQKRVEELVGIDNFLFKANQELQEIAKNACEERPLLLKLERATRRWFKDECGEEYCNACTVDEMATADALATLDKARGERKVQA